MNGIVTTGQKALMPVTADEARKPLLVLFSAYDPPFTDRTAEHRQKLMDAKVSAYLLAVQGIPAWAIERTVTDFIQGRIERRRRDKLPTAEEIAAVAREHVTTEAARQQAERERRGQIADAKSWEEHQAFLKTPEGQQHQRQRAERAALIMRTAAQSMSKE
jgi:hypothetical protein